MRSTKTITGSKAREALKKGVNAIYEPVRVTFGHEGKNALLYRTNNRGNRITNDGVTVSECQEPKDQFVRMASQTFKEACKRTNEKVGDGTTGTTIVAGKLFNEACKVLDKNHSIIGSNSGTSPISIKKEILASAELVKKEIKKSSKKVKNLKDLEKIAIISVEDEELGKIVAKMAWEVGVDGFIDIVEGYKSKIETEVIKGMRFPAKVAGSGFVNNPGKFEMVAKDCDVLITNYELDNEKQVSDFLNPLLDKHPKMVIISPKFSSEVLTGLYQATYNTAIGKNGEVVKTKAKYDLLPVLAPSLRTEQLEDLAIYFGAKFIDKNKGDKLSSITESDLGFAEKIVVKDTEAKEDAIATGGQGTRDTTDIEGKDVEVIESAVTKRLNTLKDQLRETRQEQFKKLMERRIASMASAVGIIRVGDSTEASSYYKKLKIEDAVFACRAALKSGYVKGGGLCLKEIADKMEDSIMKTAILAPYEQIASSVDGELEIGDDIIDPADAIYYSIEHATKVVANLITVDTITVEIEDPVMGEGEYAIARMLREFVITDKINKGQLKEGEVEVWKDRRGGLTDAEFDYINED